MEIQLPLTFLVQIFSCSSRRFVCQTEPPQTQRFFLSPLQGQTSAGNANSNLADDMELQRSDAAPGSQKAFGVFLKILYKSRYHKTSCAAIAKQSTPW